MPSQKKKLPKPSSPPVVWAAAYQTNIQDLKAFLERQEYVLAFYIASPYVLELLEVKNKESSIEVFNELLELIEKMYPADTEIIKARYLIA